VDLLTAFVASSHLKLRLKILNRHPEYLQDASDMEIRAPIELAGLKSRLARAKALEGRAATSGKRFDAALDSIDAAIGAVEKHAGQLEQYGSELQSTIDGMTAGSNGAPEEIAAAVGPDPTPGPNGGPRIL
jgi:hypothetical protein